MTNLPIPKLSSITVHERAYVEHSMTNLLSSTRLGTKIALQQIIKQKENMYKLEQI